MKFQESGVAEIHIKGLPILWFKTDHRINVLEQPKAIRITQHGRTLTATLVYEFPNYPPTPVTYQSCGIDPGVVQRLTVVNDQGKYQQLPGIDASRHRRQDGKAKRRFRWNHKPSRKYLQVIAQLRKVERKRIKTLQAEEHYITTEIVRNHQVIAIEDTAILNMTRSARGTAESPGKNVAQKRGLNRSILSQRWGAINQKLEYKSRWYGRQFVRVPAAHTSQTCPACGNVDARNRLTQANFKCVRCGTKTNADVIGAENIRRRGVTTMAGVGNPAHGLAPVNRRSPMGKKQRIRALQRPLLLFTKTRT